VQKKSGEMLNYSSTVVDIYIILLYNNIKYPHSLMRIFPQSLRRSSFFIVGGGTLLLAISIYGSTMLSSTQTGRVTSEAPSRGTLHTVQEFGSVITKTRKLWRENRANLRNGTTVTKTKVVANESASLTLHNAHLSAAHLDITYSLPITECVSLWTMGAANQRFERLSVIGGIPCSMATGNLSARLLLTSIHPELAEGQLIKLCTNSTQQCTQPIAIAIRTVAAPHSAAGASITIHAAIIIRNSSLSVTYSKSAGCVNLVRWNGAGDSQNVAFTNGSFSCDAAENAQANITIQEMQPVLGVNQWIHLCDQNDTTSCSNVLQIR
jgi:hypothetical protein